MFSPVKLLVFGIILLGVGYTTNITTIPEPSSEIAPAKNCTPLTVFRVFSCFFRLGDFMRKLYFLDIEKKSSLRGFYDSCSSLHEFLASLSCGKNDANDTEMINKIGSYCSGLHYMFEEFHPCLNKFEEKKPECFSSWSPFLDKEKNGTEKSQDEICKNFFGKDNCMKKEVTETCSKKEWQGLRDHFIKITPDVKDCKLEDL
uniref:DUF19 domain-containing protein n=1 Tax=Caenorhabditis tropicalis TaxID=1561998 RepID=A0A1I7V299_9PELO